jgi:hypothetical protein
VVVEVDVVVDAVAQLVHGGEGVPVEVLVLEDRPEALRTGVVVATAGGPHGTDDAESGAELLDLVVAELAPAIGMEDGARASAEPGGGGLGECIEDDLGAHVIGQGPAEDP